MEVLALHEDLYVLEASANGDDGRSSTFARSATAWRINVEYYSTRMRVLMDDLRHEVEV